MNNPTLAYQQAFAAHLRNPQQYATPTAVDPQRMQIYVDLLFNNLQDFLSTTFPVTYSILSNNEWLSLVRAFYAEHACQTPYFREIAGECVQWLSQRQPSLALCQKYPFLIELMHYEWVEIALLSDASVIDDSLIQAPADLLNNPLVLNPVLLLQAYQYPVQRISPQQLPAAEPTYLALVRNPQHKIDFIELNAITFQLLHLLQQGLTANQALQQLAPYLPQLSQAQLSEFTQQHLKQLQQQHIILGELKTTV